MNRTAITSPDAPAALGPYSQAIVAGGFVFCSGTTGIDPETGVAPPGIEAQTEQALLNLAAVLTAAGSSMADLVKTTIFYAEVEDFPTLNEVYARHMPDPRAGPIRTGQRQAAPGSADLHRRDCGCRRRPVSAADPAPRSRPGR